MAYVTIKHGGVTFDNGELDAGEGLKLNCKDKFIREDIEIDVNYPGQYEWTTVETDANS